MPGTSDVFILLGGDEEEAVPLTVLMFCHQTTQKVTFLLLPGTSWDLNNTAMMPEPMGGASDDGPSIRVSHMFLLNFTLLLSFRTSRRREEVSEGLAKWMSGYGFIWSGDAYCNC